MANFQFITYWDESNKVNRTMLINFDQIVYIEKVNYDIGKFETYYYIQFAYHVGESGCYIAKNEAYRIMKLMGISSPEI